MPFRVPALLFAALSLAAALVAAAAPVCAAPFIDAAGRRVILPDQVFRVLPADRNAEVLVYVLAPEKLAGRERLPAGSPPAAPADGYSAVLDWVPRTSPAGMAATARQVGADLIIDAGAVTPERAAFADAVQQQTHIPYILVDDSFPRMPAILKAIGAILGAGDRGADLAIFAGHAISDLRGRLLITPADTRPHVYYGLGWDGLTTPLPGSPAGAALDEAGAINVTTVLGRGTEVRVAPGQLWEWDPPVIIAERPSFYDALRRDPAWRRLAAVRENKVYLEPTYMFGWIEDPSGVNRLIGLHWLSALFYPAATQEDLRATVCDFYNKFYNVKLTNARIEALVRPAGIPPAETTHLAPEPLIGLGAAPPSSLPANAPGALSTQSPTANALTRPGRARPGGGTGLGAMSPSALTGVPGLPNTAPNAACTVPTGPSPQPLAGLGADLNAPAGTPGVAPPGRRGRAAPADTGDLPR